MYSHARSSIVRICTVTCSALAGDISKNPGSASTSTVAGALGDPDDRVGGHQAALLRPVRTGRPSTAALTIRINSRFDRSPAAPNRSICTATPIARASGRQPGPEPRVSRSNADQVAAGTPVWCAAIADRHRRDVDAAPAADAITACSARHRPGPALHRQHRRQGPHPRRRRGKLITSGIHRHDLVDEFPDRPHRGVRTAPINPRVEAEPMQVCAAAASAA